MLGIEKILRFEECRALFMGSDFKRAEDLRFDSKKKKKRKGHEIEGGLFYDFPNKVV